MPGRSALMSLMIPLFVLCAGPALAQGEPDGWQLRPPDPRPDPRIEGPVAGGDDWRRYRASPEALADQPDPLPPTPDTAPRRGRSIVAPRADEPGPGPSSWDDLADGDGQPVRPGGRTLPPPPQADGRSSPGAGQAVSPTGPMIFPAPTETTSVEDQAPGVNAACTALTDPMQRDLCRRGGVAGQPSLPPTPQ